MTDAAPAAPLLEIDSLSVRFRTKRGMGSALDHASLRIPPATSVGLVGESGCGKSTLMKAIMGVLAENAEVTSGRILHAGTDLLRVDSETLRRKRWAEISMITQSALNSLDPVHTVGDQIVEAIRAHRPMPVDQARELAARMLSLVGVEPRRARDYPHQFSGGMRQRAIIAMSLVLEPGLVLADEPTTSLDMIVQDQIFGKIRELQARLGFSMLLVTHDLAVVIENCSHMAVMYAGRVIEEGPVADVVNSPFHPYTLGLKNSLPRIERAQDPIAIPGAPPDPVDMPPGCRFAPRCPFALPICRRERPRFDPVADGHFTACHRHHEMPRLRAKATEYATWQSAGATDPRETTE